MNADAARTPFALRTAPWWREGDEIVISVPKRQSRLERWLSARLGTARRVNVRLDALGARIHELCDGRSTVATIAGALASRGETPSPVALATHLANLERLGAIRLSQTPGASLAGTEPARVACACGHVLRTLEPEARFACPACGRRTRPRPLGEKGHAGARH